MGILRVPRPRSIRWKLITLILLIKAFTLLFLGIGLYYSQQRLIQQSLVRNLSILAEVISSHTAAAVTFQDAPAAAETLKSLGGNPRVRMASVYAAGKLFAGYRRPGTTLPLPVAPPSGDLLDFRNDRVGLVRPIQLNGRTIGILYVESDTGELTALMEDFVNFSLLLYTAIFGLTVLAAVRFQRWITTPITRLAETTQAVAQRQDYSLRAQKLTEDELGTLVEDFNAMLGEIQRRDRELQHAHDSLEQRVEERTEALVQATNQLKSINRDLEKVNLELDSFVYTASHDLRAPLRAISSFAGFLQEDYGSQLDDQAKEYIKEIRGGTDRMNRLITDLLTLSRITRIRNPYEHVDLNAVLQAIVTRLEFDLKATGAVLDIPAHLPKVYCDRIKITEALLNLLHNAVKFTSKLPHGTARIQVGYFDRPGEHVLFVKDNGIGIEPQYHEQIFGLFKRLHSQEEFEGTGAGLNIVKRIVEDHGGTVWVESSLGHGACFSFSVPKRAGAPASGP